MHCIFINLDDQPARRAFVEQNFARHADPQWRLHRFAAVAADRLPRPFVDGALRDSEKACFASHVGALEKSLDFAGETMILEDDVWFGPQSAELINRARAAAAADPSWGMVFSDVGVLDAQGMFDLFVRRREWDSRRRLVLIDLRTLHFAGATAYIVSEALKPRLLAMLRKLSRFDLPYDIVLRHWIRREAFAARVIFPFATSLSVFADDSQIQLPQLAVTDACWTAFRRLVCADAFAEGLDPLHKLGSLDPAYCDRAAEAFGKVLTVRLSRNFMNK